MRRVPDDCFRRYLPISEDDRAWGLHVICGGYLHMAPGSVYPPPGHPQRYNLPWNSGRILDEFQLHLITRGCGAFECAHDKARTVEAGMVFLLFPGVWHRYQPDPVKGWDEYWIGFDGEHARRIMRPPFFSSKQSVIQVGEPAALLDQFTAIVTTMRQEHPQMQRQLSGIAGMLLSTLQVRVAGGSVDSRGARHIQAAKRAIAAALKRPIDGQVIANDLGVGYHWLRRAFRQLTGMSLHQYHLQLRVHAAMQLLEGGEREINDVAQEVGFEDPFYFSRVFRKLVGASPQGWQKQRRGGS